MDMRTIGEKCLSKSESFGQPIEGVSTAFDHSAFIQEKLVNIDENMMSPLKYIVCYNGD